MSTANGSVSEWERKRPKISVNPFNQLNLCTITLTSSTQTPKQHPIFAPHETSAAQMTIIYTDFPLAKQLLVKQLKP
jgi:hypothetical protein